MSSDGAGTVPATPVKSTVSASDVGYPNGHLGHLTPKEEEAFVQFKELLIERELYKPGPPASHDDPLLLRYLRARRWVPSDALTQFSETEAWRKANDIDVLYHTIDVDAYESSRRLYPQWTGRRDRRGIPLYVFEIKNLDAKTVSEYERKGAKSTFSDAKTDGKTQPGLLRLFSLYENLTRFNMPFCTQLLDREHPEVPITMSTNIVDVSNVGLKQFWNLKNHMQVASQLATAHYPETLDRIFVIGAPFFFNTVWGWIKRWFDPITVSKIFILGQHEVKSTLESFIDIRNIPKKYGGELDFEWGQLSIPDPAWEGIVQWENGFSEFPSGPLLWEETDNGKKLACIAHGRVDGKDSNGETTAVPTPANAADPKTEEITSGAAVENLTIEDEKKAAQAPAGGPAATVPPTAA
ncbi:CRAL/TRIO domain-containing protein [Sarocladium strictum]